jgi:hypothetical protein
MLRTNSEFFLLEPQELETSNEWAILAVLYISSTGK